MNTLESGSFLAGTLIAIAVVAILGGGGYVAYKALSQPPEPQPSCPETDESEIAHATTNMFHLFRDAQYDYIHRHDGVMATSITQLGNGFSIGSFGSLIHEEIWLARYDRPEEETINPPKSDMEKAALARPYRYAILAVKDCWDKPVLDARTTCILAIPVSPNGQDSIPMLVLLGGPIRSDPRDFIRQYPIHRISDATACRAFRDAASSGKPVSREFLSINLPEWQTSAPQ